MKNNNCGFKNERFEDSIHLEGDNMRIELISANDYYLTRNPQVKNDGFEIIKSELRGA